MLDKLTAKLSLVNWQYQMYKVLLILVIATGWTYFVWDNGKDRGYSKCNAETVTEVIRVVNSRMPVIQQAERGAARLEQELSTIKEKLDEQVDRDVAADCSITDEQLFYYRQAADKTKPR